MKVQRPAMTPEGRFPIEHACPACGAGVGHAPGEGRCAGCGTPWRRRGELADFRGGDVYWGEVDRATMGQVLSRAETEGWREGLQRELGGSHPETVWYASSETRADFRYLLPGRPQSVVLDAGSGWGTLSVPLARAYRWVVALDSVWERMRFLETRARQEKVRNLQLVLGEAHRPPFPPGSFDLVVANGLLEWVAVREPDADPREAQLRFLRTMRRQLRPGGALYVGIENRYGIGQWRGHVDHSGYRFTSLMPRAMAERYVRFRRSRAGGEEYRTHGAAAGYRTYTYSLDGYRRLLLEAGFTRVASYTSLQGYNDPDQIVPLDHDGAMRAFFERMARPRSGAVRLLRAALGDAWWPLELRLRRFTAPSFLFVAYAGSPDGAGGGPSAEAAP